MYETYLKDTPWIVLIYRVTDQEADANSGRSHVDMECCICGTVERKHFTVPPDGDPVYKTIDPKNGLPECHKLKVEFQLAHMHPNQHGNAVLTWARPLRNLAAVKGGLNLEELAERLRNDLKKMVELN